MPHTPMHRACLTDPSPSGDALAMHALHGARAAGGGARPQRLEHLAHSSTRAEGPGDPAEGRPVA